jgi:hypothetical protein
MTLSATAIDDGDCDDNDDDDDNDDSAHFSKGSLMHRNEVGRAGVTFIGGSTIGDDRGSLLTRCG